MSIDAAIFRSIQHIFRYDLTISARNDEIRLQIQDILIIVSDLNGLNNLYSIINGLLLDHGKSQDLLASHQFVRLTDNAYNVKSLVQ